MFSFVETLHAYCADGRPAKSHAPGVWHTHLRQYSSSHAYLPESSSMWQLSKHAHKILVSQARPFPFRSADRFQYLRCGTERVWLARLVTTSQIAAWRARIIPPQGGALGTRLHPCTCALALRSTRWRIAKQAVVTPMARIANVMDHLQ